MGADNYQHPFLVYGNPDEAGMEARRFFVIPPELYTVQHPHAAMRYSVCLCKVEANDISPPRTYFD